MTAAPHLFLRGRFEIGGKEVAGHSAEGLPPKWFVKSPDTTFDEDLPDMIQTIRSAIDAAIDIGTREGFGEWWRALYERQAEFSEKEGTPPLLAHLGTSLVERAGIDATCRARGHSFFSWVMGPEFDLDLGTIHPELEGTTPADWLARGQTPNRTLLLRHTVGLADPLTEADISEEDRVDDGLPQSLDACVEKYGLHYFKIKLSGQPEVDADRLRKLSSLLAREAPGFRYTLDGNEQFREWEGFRSLWEELQGEESLEAFLSPKHLLFVEQPLHREVALDPAVGEGLRNWKDAPPMIIDESDATLETARQALDLGYSGTSHKNCKGVLKGIANACLLRQRASEEPDREWILSGEDLANVGPVALLQDLAVMNTLGIRHVERNGHHYFPGLEMFSPSIQEAVLAHHGDLYREHRGCPALSVQGGEIEIGSVVDAPFGTEFEMGEVIDDWRPIESWEAEGAFRGY